MLKICDNKLLENKLIVMKKIFFLFCLVFSLCSCSTMKIANITAFKPNGEILCEYKNICLDENAFKSFGLNFYDGRRYVVLPNSLPYKVEYIYTTKTDIMKIKRHPMTFKKDIVIKKRYDLEDWEESIWGE